MKNLVVLTIGLCIFAAGSVFADKIVIEKGWANVPITVEGDTYTVTRTLPTTTKTTNYYYSYAGHYCFREKRTDVDVDPVTLKASVSGRDDSIYCYPSD